MFRWWCDGVLILLTHSFNSGVIVRGRGSAVLGCRLVANRLHSRTEQKSSSSSSRREIKSPYFKFIYLNCFKH